MGGLQTALTRQLGIKYPILSAGMGGAAGPELVAAVSNAGGLGVLGASSFAPPQLRQLVARTRKLTDKPLGINLIIDDRDLSDDDKKELSDQVSAAAEERPAVLVLFWGDAGPYVELAHRHNVKLFIQVGSAEEAQTAAAAGVDGVIAQGFEAGGHVRGTTSIWALLPATVEAVKPLPVLASGGIGDGPGIARALALGAQGVSLGTRFVASDEALVHPAYKRRIVEATAADTVYNELYDIWWPDAPARTLRNKTLAEWEAAGRPPSGKRPGEGTSIGKRRSSSGEVVDWPRYATGTAGPDFDGDIEYTPMWAGESCDLVNDIKPAGEIVRRLAREAARAL
jgi:nitronate monooxygenase